MKARVGKYIVILVALGLILQQAGWAQGNLLRARAWGERAVGQYPPTPTELLKQEGQRLQEEIKPLLDSLRQTCASLSSQKPLSEATRIAFQAMRGQLDEIVVRVSAAEVHLDYAAETSEGNKQIILRALRDSITDRIRNALTGIEPALYLAEKYNELTSETLNFIKSGFDKTESIIESIIAIKDIRLHLTEFSSSLYIPGFDDIRGFPSIMTSFETEIQTMNNHSVAPAPVAPQPPASATAALTSI